MKKTFKYPRFYYLGLFLIWGILGILFFGLFGEALTGSNTIWKAISIFILVFLIYSCLSYWRGLETSIELTDNGLALRIPFRKYDLLWEDITEFGRIRQFANPYRGYVWTYYVKGKGSKNKKLFLGSVVLSNINELCLLLFEKAKNAKFITLENKSIIPFAKRYTESEWKKEITDKESPY